MKKKSLLAFMLSCSLCFMSTASKECGKIVGEKSVMEAADQKSNTEKKADTNKEDQTEFSLINMLFFQTT